VNPPELAAVFAVLVVVVVAGFITLTTYNAVAALGLRIDKAWANIDVALKQRHDSFPTWCRRSGISWRSSRMS
jgi:hypothetical protein